MSVFRASSSAAAWPTAADPFADGPTERLASADSDGPSEPPPRRGLAFAVLLAMVALLVSAGAGLLAWRALGRAEQAYARTLPAVGTAAPGPVSNYAGVVLRIRAGCDAVTVVDLDEPRVNAPTAGGDLRYEARCGETRPRVALGDGAVAGSEAEGEAEAEDVGEGGCAEAIRTRPLGGGTSTPVREGAVFCILTGRAGRAASPGPSVLGSYLPGSPEPGTSATGADPEASPGEPSAAPGTVPTLGPGAAGTGVRLVRVEVTDVTKDGTAELRATSWAVR